ncbi:nitrate reductase molybdenum cofactor assembly chaperone [Streptomyces sp. MAR4 CNX-425]|uniref:nitrate reductase molybdenum cofactor assembly chaperone n=1 Tax=Streptomyces sp. MAR4 CNX-425 TaxID=3406343 RepID=UPI003B50E450
MSTAVVRQVAARCLGYPDDDFFAALPSLRRALPARHALHGFLDHAERIGPADLAAHYVEVFDFRARRCLYLTWWTDGDTRRRGMAMVRFKEVYRSYGMDLTGEELPDFLPAVLEFTAATGDDGLLTDHRPAVELLRLSLAEHGTPYAAVLDAVCATLPGPSPKDRAAALALARGGPPREDVGLEPYGHAPLPLVDTPGGRS